MLQLPEHQRMLNPDVLKRLAVVQLLILLPIAYVLPLVFTPLILAAPVWVALRIQFRRSPRINRWLLIAITLLTAVLVWRYFGTIRGRDAGVALIGVMYSLKILESQKYRDLNLLLTLGFFVISMAFLFNQSFILMLYMFALFLLIVHSLMLVNANNTIHMQWKLGAKILVLTLPLMIILFLFFPRLPGPLWKMPNQSSAGTGISDSMTPGDIGALNLSELPAFRVKFNSQQKPLASQLYWRGLVFENYDGLTWREDEQRNNIFNPIFIAPEQLSDSAFDYAITLEPSRQRWLFALDIPVNLPNRNRRLIQSDATFKSPIKINKRIKYQVISDTQQPLEQQLSPIARQINLALPEEGNDQSRVWATQQYALVNDPQEFVNFLLRYINNEPYFYTLQPPIMLEDMVDDFWFNHKKGFCEHYAGAMTFMLRAAHIPARVVTGYQGGEYNPVGDYYLIMQRDAHAWIEYWVEDKGWIRVDPTSAIAPFRIDESLLQEMGARGFLFDELPSAEMLESDWLDYARQWMDNANTFWREWVIDFDQSNQFNLFKKFNLDGFSKRVIYVIGGVVFIFIVALIGWRIMRNYEPQDDTAKAFNQLLKLLKSKGFEKPVQQGAQSFLQEVWSKKPQWKSSLEPILKTYLHLRYKTNQPDDRLTRHLVSQVRRLKLS